MVRAGGAQTVPECRRTAAEDVAASLDSAGRVPATPRPAPQGSVARCRGVGRAASGRLLLSVMCVVCAGCAASGTPKGETEVRIIVSGSSTIGPLLREVARRYERDHSNVRVDIQTGGSARGLSDVRRGLSQIGMVSRALGENERDLRGHVIGFDAVALIVHADNPVPGLSMEQLRRIYRRQVRDWASLGGPRRPIVLVHKAEGRSTLEVFLRATGLTHREIQPDIVAGENEQVIKTVAANPAAIGYVSLGAALHHLASGTPIRVVPLDEVTPEEAAVRSGVYPMARTLALVTRPQPGPAVEAFIDFVRSADVADLFERWHFVRERSDVQSPLRVH